MRLRRKRRGEEAFLAVFDVGATSVGVCIAYMEQGIVTVLWHTRIEYSYQAYDDYTRYERAMYATLLEAGMRLMSEGLPAVRRDNPAFKAEYMQASCILAAPWFFGAVHRTEKQTDKPFTAHEDLVRTLVEEGQQTVRSIPESVSWHEVVGNSVCIERERQQVYLNGYPVQHLTEQDVTHMSVQAYFAFVGEDVLHQVQDIIERVLPNHEVSVTTSTHVLARLYTHTLGSGTGNRAFLVEVEGRITSIASIHQSILTRITTIPRGTNHLLKAVAPTALSTAEAQGKLTTARAHKDSTDAPKTTQALYNASHEWITEVIDEYKKHSNGVVPPEHIFLMVDNPWYDILVPLLKEPWLMPGIREERSSVVTPFSVFIQKQTQVDAPDAHHVSTDDGDSRLELFSHALFYCAPTHHDIL